MDLKTKRNIIWHDFCFLLLGYMAFERKTVKANLVLAAAAAFMVPAVAASAILPVGVQTNVTKTTVTEEWGWSQCYQGGYNASVSLSSLFASCDGDYLMLAASPSDANPVFTVLAAAATADVTMPVFNNVTNTANGVEWYYRGDRLSWGFAQEGAAVNRQNCDTNGLNEETRLCWHMNDTQVFSGWRAGSSFSLDGNATFQRYVFSASSVDAPSADVPAPAAFGLLGLGLAAIGMRRRRR